MAKKKIITKKVKTVEEDIKKKDIKKEEEKDIDAFDVDDAPEGDEEVSDLEQEISEDEASEFDEEIQEERFYTVPLAKGFEKAPKWNYSNKAMKVIRKFLTQHMKPEGDVYIAQEVNERIWENGIKNPPRKIRVRVTKSIDGIVRAYLA